MIPIYVGFDQREACVFHVFNQSVIEHASQPVSIVPLATKLLHFDGQQDGTNAFIYSRYLVPYLQGFEGWALFCDGDMIVMDDISELWALRDDRYAVMLVKHDYQCTPRKYIGTPIENDNIAYPRKNWSSVMLINCAHEANKILDREFVAEAGGDILHRFGWLDDDEIGELPVEWNWLCGEYDLNPDAKLYHHTLGSPGFEHYMRSESHQQWNGYLNNALHMIGERPAEMVRRAEWRSNGGYYQSRDIRNGGRRLSG